MHKIHRKSWAEPFRIKVVEALPDTTREQREQALREAQYDVSKIRSEDIRFDLSSDSTVSGVGMSSRQWAEMQVRGCESSKSSAQAEARLGDAVRRCYGMDHAFPMPDIKSARTSLHGVLSKDGCRVLVNGVIGASDDAEDICGAEAYEIESISPFKGNADIEKLKTLVQEQGRSICYVMIEVPSASIGGQPVSMENLREVSAVCRNHGIKTVLCGSRAVENAYFIKMREAEYYKKPVVEILNEMSSCFDACIVDGRKDPMAGGGAFVAFNDRELFEAVSRGVSASYTTEAGLMALGLEEAVQGDYAIARVSLVEHLGDKLEEFGVPILQPVGGHAVFVNATKVFSRHEHHEAPARSLATQLYLEAGIRGMEWKIAGQQLLRLALPRRTYTKSQCDLIAEWVDEVCHHC